MGKRRPSPDSFDVAIAWLRVNEGADGERDACFAVADWLVDQEETLLVRRVARESRLPTDFIRKRIAKKKSIGS